MPRLDDTVELVGYYGSDETISLAAWTSTSRDLTEEKKARIGKLIHMLWEDGHHSPFEKSHVQFLVNCNISSHIQILKHRISSVNSESARYRELKEDKYYIPKDWPTNWAEKLEEYTKQGNELYHQCLADLEPVLGRKRAKESARFFKTYNSQIQADVTFNMRSFANFIKLRKSDQAQLEIREVASKMLELVENIDGNPFKETLSAWRTSGVIT